MSLGPTGCFGSGERSRCALLRLRQVGKLVVPGPGEGRASRKEERVRGVDLYRRNAPHSRLEAAGKAALFTESPKARWARGKGQLRMLPRNRESAVSQSCAETPERAPAKQNQSIELEREAGERRGRLARRDPRPETGGSTQGRQGEGRTGPR